MFNNLIESTANAKENKKQTAYFGLTTAFYVAFCALLLVWSIFSFDVSALNNDSDLTVETLVAPAIIEQPNVPPPPRETRQTKTDSPKNAAQNIDLLRNPVKNINNSTDPPKGINVEKVDFDETRENIPYTVAKVTKYTDGASEEANPRRTNAPGIPDSIAKQKQSFEEDEKAPPPAVKQKPSPTPNKVTTISKGVINSIAVNLPKPAYPPSARAVNASGAVQVQVTIDEHGKVISAVAASGHPLLKAAAVEAAKRAKFTPTILSDQAVKVTGVIVYNFVP